MQVNSRSHLSSTSLDETLTGNRLRALSAGDTLPVRERSGAVDGAKALVERRERQRQELGARAYLLDSMIQQMGGGDIFFSKPYNGEYVSPVNLGAKFNTSSDDFGFIIDRDKKNGYFSSDREGGKGQDDIYSFFVGEDSGAKALKFVAYR